MSVSWTVCHAADSPWLNPARRHGKYNVLKSELRVTSPTHAVSFALLAEVAAEPKDTHCAKTIHRVLGTWPWSRLILTLDLQRSEHTDDELSNLYPGMRHLVDGAVPMA